MDLKAYYRDIRELESSLPDEDVVVVSLVTPDGGRAGARSEVSRLLAAKLVIERKARLASGEEASQYRSELAEASERAREEAAASRVQVAIVREPVSERAKAKTRK